MKMTIMERVRVPQRPQSILKVEKLYSTKRMAKRRQPVPTINPLGKTARDNAIHASSNQKTPTQPHSPSRASPPTPPLPLAGRSSVGITASCLACDIAATTIDPTATMPLDSQHDDSSSGAAFQRSLCRFRGSQLQKATSGGRPYRIRKQLPIAIQQATRLAFFAFGR